MVDEMSMNKVMMHGCAAGLRSEGGIPIKKPWTIATTSGAIHDLLGKFRCPGKDVHPEHAACAGRETKRTENYTLAMADAVHLAIKEESLSFRASAALVAIPGVRGEHDDAENDMMDIPDPSGHREKIGGDVLWCALITKTLAPGDPLSRSPPALKAIDDELTDLRAHHVWDETNPKEAQDVARDEPDAHIARVFPIVGIKHFEDVSMQKLKGRIVLAGNRVKTATGQWAVFAELGSIPSTMAACRCVLILFALIKGARLLQSDCVRAYVQAEMRGPTTYIRLPRAWWPKGWANLYKDPVCQLRRALYGHPDAGDFWAEKLGGELERLEFQKVEGWPSVHILYPEAEMTIGFVIYVDDLIMVGSVYLETVLVKLRATINMEDPSDLQKYLGCVHEIVRKAVKGEVITSIKFDMTKYFQAAIDQYIELSGEKLSKAPTPFAPKIDPAELDRLMNEPGKLAPHAASLVMKLMYGVRMAGPHLTTIVSRLSSLITKWTKDADRRLHRVYCYLHGAVELTLMGTLSTEDFNEMELVAWPDADFCGDLMSARSTSGFFLEVRGKDGRSMPISWGSKKQGSTALSTCEAETISLSSCLRTEALPTQYLLQKLLRRPVRVRLMEDNAATVTAVLKGYSPALRHIPRSHKVSLSFVHEMCTLNEEPEDGEVRIVKASTEEHRGDMFTKELDTAKFLNALNMIRMG